MIGWSYLSIAYQKRGIVVFWSGVKVLVTFTIYFRVCVSRKLGQDAFPYHRPDNLDASNELPPPKGVRGVEAGV